MSRKIRYGMVGGGRGAFIGAVHRIAAAMDQQVELVCGAFSSDPAKSKASGGDFFLPADRCYGSFQEMITSEAALPADQRMDFISIVTPNHMHFPPAKAALEAGFHVLSDKPATFNLAEAKSLAEIVKRTGLLYGLTHNYTGYPLVKQAREMIAAGKLGKLRKVVVEYPQGWLATRIEASGQKQASWRTDPKQAGAGALGDIGSHAFQLAEFVTGAQVSEVAADVSALVPGRVIDDNVNVMLRFANGARGSLWASQVAIGHLNSHRLRVYGDAGSIQWFQERPEELLVVEQGEAPRSVRRGDPGTPTSSVALPGGHPEGFIEAFSQLYTDFAERVTARLEKRSPKAASLFAPDAATGTRVMAFIEAVLKSGQANSAWTRI